MFSEEHYNFRYPLFVTSIHMIVQFLFSGTSLFIIPSLRPNKQPSFRDYIYKVLPCALATSLDIGLSNLSLKSITLSFYTMCKSSTLAFVLIFAFIFKLEKPNWKLILIILIITVGVVLMVSDETDFSLIGFIQVMAASCFGGLRWSLTEVLLRKESMGLTNPFASIFFLAPSQALILLTLSAGVEGYVTIFKSAFFITFREGLHTMAVILAGGSLAFCMIVSEFFLIKRTSVVTLSVCGIFKEVATIFISSLVFGDILTLINIIGLCITLFGIGLYNWLKLKVMRTTTSHNKEISPANVQENVELEGAHFNNDVDDDQDTDMNDEADDEEGDEEDDEEDEESEDDEMDIDGKKKTKKYTTEAFSNAMTNILASSLSGSDKKQPILARSKGVERKLEDEKLDYKARKILSAQKKALKEKGRVIPDYTTFEYEKRLRKVATRGVVKLFNAIRTQQKMTEVAVENAATTRKTLASIEKAKNVSTMSKSTFLDLLKSGQK
ncbi:Rrp15p-domain-containing protein [Cokeromyces recurvatus]|uniref:Rrp15p-domain-containing protein n=1 Tax=Cokeromyces recurvatus TaxID=90255 RepID=UPI002220D504|nr:Rrp15p-domain-containing protein [Cokeromyces recurvatus]KAI7904947.1 Rrp15p-domain-containing protein [Cokeromyces recurvatus]